MDFEAFTQTRLTNNSDPLPARARKIRRIIRDINNCCKKAGKPRPFPAGEISRARTLRTIGGPPAIGYDRRPIFTNADVTIGILENQVRKAAPAQSGWGTDVIPRYPRMYKDTNGKWCYSYDKEEKGIG